MKTALKIALLVMPTLALGQERVLPNDVLVGGLDSVLAIKQLTPITYEFSQLTATSGAPQGGQYAMCAGAALAHLKGYAGLSLGAVDDGTPSGFKRTLTVAVLNAPGEVAALPATLKWLPYRDIKSLRDICATFVQARYLWPANP